MDYNDLSRFIVNGCVDALTQSKESAINEIEDIFYELENNEQFKTVLDYLLKYFENVSNIHDKIKSDILGILDHECEVFDPICDGPVEHAEGIAMAREFVEIYFKEKLGGE